MNRRIVLVGQGTSGRALSILLNGLGATAVSSIYSATGVKAIRTSETYAGTLGKGQWSQWETDPALDREPSSKTAGLVTQYLHVPGNVIIVTGAAHLKYVAAQYGMTHPDDHNVLIFEESEESTVSSFPGYKIESHKAFNEAKMA